MSYVPPIPPGVVISRLPNAGALQDGDQLLALRNGQDVRVSGTSMVSPTSIARQVTQTAHGFVIGDLLAIAGEFLVKAKANNPILADVVGIVSGIGDANTFSMTMYGYVTGLSDLIPDTVNYLSTTVSGKMQTHPPAEAFQVSKVVLIADSTTSGYFVNYIGQIV